MPERADSPELPSDLLLMRRGQEADAQARMKAAVVAVIAQDGFSALSVESICNRARVPVAAFHHRWAAAEDALADALDDRARLSRLPDTGNVASDLVAYMQGYLDACSDPEFAGFMFYVMAQIRVDPRLARKLDPGFVGSGRSPRACRRREAQPAKAATAEITATVQPFVCLWEPTGVSEPMDVSSLAAARRVCSCGSHCCRCLWCSRSPWRRQPRQRT